MNPQIGSGVQYRANGGQIYGGVVVGNVSTSGDLADIEYFQRATGNGGTWAWHGQVTHDESLSADHTFKVISGGV